MRDFRKLDFWIRSHQFTLRIYTITRQFPKGEMFTLTSQMRRSSSSIPTNIAEGCGFNSNPQLKKFFNISIASSSELQYQLILARDLSYIDEQTFSELYTEIQEIRKMIYTYISRF